MFTIRYFWWYKEGNVVHRGSYVKEVSKEELATYFSDPHLVAIYLYVDEEMFYYNHYWLTEAGWKFEQDCHFGQ